MATDSGWLSVHAARLRSRATIAAKRDEQALLLVQRQVQAQASRARLHRRGARRSVCRCRRRRVRPDVHDGAAVHHRVAIGERSANPTCCSTSRIVMSPSLGAGRRSPARSRGRRRLDALGGLVEDQQPRLGHAASARSTAAGLTAAREAGGAVEQIFQAGTCRAPRRSPCRRPHRSCTSAGSRRVVICGNTWWPCGT